MPPTEHPSKGIKNILDGLGTTANWKTAMGKTPDTDNSIGLFDPGGLDPDPGLALDYPSVQIIVQGGAGPTGYPDAIQKALEIKRALLGIPSSPAAYPELTLCKMMGDIGFLGYTDADRPRFSMNFSLITEPDATQLGHRESL